jgi:hypothetical protein
MNHSLRTGIDIYTRDGDRLGQVKELRGDYFKVDAPMSPDYWLSTECLRGSMGTDRVEVLFAKGELDDYKRDID